MAATATTQKLSANLAVNIFSSTAGMTSITDILFPDIVSGSNLWLDMSESETVMFLVTVKLRTDDLEQVIILSNPNSDGSGTDYEVKDSGTLSDYNAVGDYFVIEATAEQLDGNRYCTIQVKGGHADDDFTIIAIRGGSRFARSALTASFIS